MHEFSSLTEGNSDDAEDDYTVNHAPSTDLCCRSIVLRQ